MTVKARQEEAPSESRSPPPVVDLADVPHTASDAARSLYAFFDGLRERHPVVQARTDEGEWYTFLRTETAKSILLDTDTFRTYHPDGGESGYFEEELLPASKDPPQHKQYRQIIQAPFSPRAAKALEPHMRRFAAALIDSFASTGRCDFIADFAQPYPALVFFEMMQFPMEDLPAFTKWEGQFWTLPAEDPEGSVRKSGLESLREYVRAQVGRKRATPDDSLIGVLIRADIEGRPLTDEEIVSYGVLACIGGIHTTKAVLGRLMLHLARRSDHRARLREQPDLIRRFVDEALRVYAIGESFRFAARDVEVDGCPLKRGDRLSVHWPAVNRDPRAFHDPTEIHLDAPAPPNRAFGYGPHFCVGMHIARRDMVVAVEEWLRRIPDFSLPAGATVMERVWGGAGLYNLPLRWTSPGGDVDEQ